MLPFRLSTDLVVGDAIAGLNIYAERRNAFDDTAINTGLLLATHAAMAIAAHISADRAADLHRALNTNRDIGVAIGILMSRQHELTRAQAVVG
jgi:hypothetical protein